MGRKPNYKFERLERQRAKAAKKASKLEARENAEKRSTDDEGIESTEDDTLTDTPGRISGSPEGSDNQNR